MVKHTHNKNNTNFEKLVLFVATVEPLSSIPQIYEIFNTHDVKSISLSTWVLFELASVVWLMYGIKTKSLPLIVSSILWVSTELLIVIGILLYS